MPHIPPAPVVIVPAPITDAILPVMSPAVSESDPLVAVTEAGTLVAATEAGTLVQERRQPQSSMATPVISILPASAAISTLGIAAPSLEDEEGPLMRKSKREIISSDDSQEEDASEVVAVANTIEHKMDAALKSADDEHQAVVEIHLVDVIAEQDCLTAFEKILPVEISGKRPEFEIVNTIPDAGMMAQAMDSRMEASFVDSPSRGAFKEDIAHHESSCTDSVNTALVSAPLELAVTADTLEAAANVDTAFSEMRINMKSEVQPAILTFPMSMEIIGAMSNEALVLPTETGWVTSEVPVAAALVLLDGLHLSLETVVVSKVTDVTKRVRLPPTEYWRGERPNYAVPNIAVDSNVGLTIALANISPVKPLDAIKTTSAPEASEDAATTIIPGEESMAAMVGCVREEASSACESVVSKASMTAAIEHGALLQQAAATELVAATAIPDVVVLIDTLTEVI